MPRFSSCQTMPHIVGRKVKRGNFPGLVQSHLSEDGQWRKNSIWARYVLREKICLRIYGSVERIVALEGSSGRYPSCGVDLCVQRIDDMIFLCAEKCEKDRSLSVEGMSLCE